MPDIAHVPAPPDFQVYTEGLFYTSVCTSLTNDDATQRLNREMPAGTTRGWRVADEPFRNGDPNGRPCHRAPDTHRHLLFDC